MQTLLQLYKKNRAQLAFLKIFSRRLLRSSRLKEIFQPPQEGFYRVHMLLKRAHRFGLV
jgi:hypothetical protein